MKKKKKNNRLCVVALWIRRYCVYRQTVGNAKTPIGRSEKIIHNNNIVFMT